MESTRMKIVDILRRRREATVEELTQSLGLAQATVRRHLDILQRDGYISVRHVRRATGRPHYAFALTGAGEDLFPQHYFRITNRLIDEIIALGPDETRGRSGRQLAAVIFERMADRLASTYGPRITGTALGERLDQAVTILNGEGIDFEIRRDGESFVLLGRSCPCRRLAEGHPELCRHDQRLLSRMLDAPVERLSTSHTEDGCAYRVSPASL